MRLSLFLSAVLTLLSLAGVSCSVESLNGMVRHFEPLQYNAQELLRHHMSKRDLDKSQIKLPFNFQAFGRRFDIELFPDDSHFTPDAKITDGTNDYYFDRSKLYSGRSRTSQPMHITGHLYHDVFTGVIVTETETYVIEPSDRHFNATQPFHSIIYKESDVIKTRGKMCGVVDGEVVERDSHNLPSFSSMFSEGIRVRRDTVNVFKRSCTVVVDLEDKYVNSVKGSITDPDQIRAIAMGQVGIHLSLVADIFIRTNFTTFSGGVFIIVPLVVINLEVEPAFSNPLLGAGIYLDIFSKIDHDEFCLAVKFTHRDFDQGVLGLAYVGNTQLGSGGICDRFTGSSGLNTGIVTTLNFGNTLSVLITSLTWGHEMGHNFGSPHDETSNCLNQPDGNYLMYSQASDGSKFNNRIFSPCSIISMTAVIEAKGANADGCFTAQTGGTFCGNGIVEDGEQCDCGFEGQCTDVCCNAATCTLKGVECSPTQGSCCSTGCVYLAVGLGCLADAECSFASNCTGVNASCPTPTPKANYTFCDNDKSVCFNGECSSSYCLFNRLFDCSIVSDNATVLCQLACTTNTSDDDACISTFQLAMTNSNITGQQQVVGGLCNGTEGYCDFFGFCTSPNDEGPLTRLTNLLFNAQTLLTIQQYLTAYWWAVMLAGILVIILLVFVTWICSVVPIPSFGFWKKKGEEDLGVGPKKKKSGLVLRNPHQ